MKGFVLSSLLLVLLLGCSIAPHSNTDVDLIAVARKEIIKNITRGCVDDIYWGRQPAYPLTDYTTYRTWRQLGGHGPSPDEWCRAYVKRLK